MRNRVVALILLPIAILLWVLGWSLFWLGVGDNDRVSRTAVGKEMVEMTVETSEEQSVRLDQR